MPTIRQPKSGALQFWPRVRAKKQVARIRSWPANSEPKPLGFAGYKVGMTHAFIKDNIPTSMTKGEEISVPLTIIECPPLKIASIVFYKNTSYGLKKISCVMAAKLDKELARKILVPKTVKAKVEDLKPEDYDVVRVLVHTQPKLTTIGKKKPDLFEVALGGSKEEQLNWAKENLGKEMTIDSTFVPGQQLDSHAITKGKGIQGPVKRFGISLRSHKSQKSRRKAVLAAEGAAKVQYTAKQPGQHGYHQRLEHNKWVLKIGDKPEEINALGGFKRYGLVKNQYLLVKGSVAGPQKRLILFTHAARPRKNIPVVAPEVTYIVK